MCHPSHVEKTLDGLQPGYKEYITLMMEINTINDFPHYTGGLDLVTLGPLINPFQYFELVALLHCSHPKRVQCTRLD